MDTGNENETGDLLKPDDPRLSFLAPSPPLVRVAFGARSHPGKVRTNNEDQWAVIKRRRTRDVLLTSLPESWLRSVEESAYTVVVADGMGGNQFGELASLLAIRAGWEIGFNDTKWSMKVSEQECEEILEKFETYGQLIHQTLIKHTKQDPSLEGMGTTLTVAYTVGLDAFIGHIGDSRAYLMHGDSLRQLTRDHTLAQRFVDAGVYSADSLEAKRLRHVLTNCLGATHGPIWVDVQHLDLEYGDYLLLCTDGLTEMVSDAEIAETDRKSTRLN